MFAESPDPTKLAEEILKATEGVSEARTQKDKCKIRDKCKACFEFCCSKNSSLVGEVNMDRGINHFRLSIDQTDMSNDVEVDCLINVMHQFKGADIYGSIPCGPWSSWQRLNCQQYGKRFQQKLKKDRKKSLKILRNYIRCAEVIMQNGGHCAFEWPKNAEGWKLPELLQFVKRSRLFVSEPQGCAFGMCDKNNVPHLKTWRIVTSCWKLAKNLDARKCKHEKGFKHAPLEGSATPKSAFYPLPMARCISYSLYEADIPAMPVELESEPVGHEEFSPDEVLAAVHLLLSRNEWRKRPGWEEAIQKEASGINANNTWSFDEVISRNDLITRSKAKGEAINIGKLMTILSVKNFETPELRKLKARIVFRGDDIRNADNTLAVLQEAKVNPTGLAGINLNLVYGALHGHKTTQSDVTRAYTQSLLKTKVPTWVELPRELTPKGHSHLERPCVRLVRALYGHPESGWHWDKRFKEIMSSMNGIHLDDIQSSYWFPKEKLLMTLYVDDMLLSGPQEAHEGFWEELSKHLEFDEPTPVVRILGRKHEVNRNEQGTTIRCSLADFAKSSCEAYEALAKQKLAKASTPYAPEGSLLDTDWETKGVLAENASRILMKILWMARLCRPDLMKSIGDLTKRLTQWSVADDKRLYRLMNYVNYVNSTQDYVLEGFIKDPMDQLQISLYTDSDHCSGIEHTKSTSGILMAIEGPSSFYPISWASRRQTATSRSTTEAETISLASGVFSEGLPAQGLCDILFGRPTMLACHQDNAAVLQIIEAGYSPKLRHVSKTHRLDLGSLYEVFESPDASIGYIATDKQRADPLTKNLIGTTHSNC